MTGCITSCTVCDAMVQLVASMALKISAIQICFVHSYPPCELTCYMSYSELMPKYFCSSNSDLLLSRIFLQCLYNCGKKSLTALMADNVS